MLRTWDQAVLLLLMAIGVYFQTWIDIWPYWENKNATYTHGTLVALVALWLAWRARSEVNQFEPAPSIRATLLVMLLSAIWLLAEKANIFIVYAALWPPVAFATLWAGLGLQAASRLAFPLSFLYFAIPVWDYLKPPLQAITSTMAGFFTSILGIPAAFDGPYVTLPTATIFIAEDCSGAHFLCVALAVGVLAGVLRGDTLRTRILILVFAGLLSMAFNWLRIVLIVLAYLHPGLKEGFETIGHVTFGWWVFALDLVVFSLVLRFVPRSSNEFAEIRLANHTTSIRWNNGAGLWMSTTALVLLPVTAWLMPRFDDYPPEVPDADLHISISEVDLTSPDLRWSPHYPGAIWEDRFAIMPDTGYAVEIYSNRYHEQSQGSELISRGSYLFDPLYFTLGSSSKIDLLDSGGRLLRVHREVFTDRSGASWLTVYTYLVDSEPIAGIRRVQLTTALRSMYGRTTAGVTAVTTLCLEDCESHISDLDETFIYVVESYQKNYLDNSLAESSRN